MPKATARDKTRSDETKTTRSALDKNLNPPHVKDEPANANALDEQPKPRVAPLQPATASELLNLKFA